MALSRRVVDHVLREREVRRTEEARERRNEMSRLSTKQILDQLTDARVLHVSSPVGHNEHRPHLHRAIELEDGQPRASSAAS